MWPQQDLRRDYKIFQKLLIETFFLNVQPLDHVNIYLIRILPINMCQATATNICVFLFLAHYRTSKTATKILQLLEYYIFSNPYQSSELKIVKPKLWLKPSNISHFAPECDSTRQILPPPPSFDPQGCHRVSNLVVISSHLQKELGSSKDGGKKKEERKKRMRPAALKKTRDLKKE